MACISFKGGRETLAKICSMMNPQPPFTDKAYAKQFKLISNAARNEATENMLQAVETVRSRYYPFYSHNNWWNLAQRRSFLKIWSCGSY